VGLDPKNLPIEALEFLVERHLASLTLVTTDGMPHVTPVGFSWDNDRGIVRVITFAGAKKARLLVDDGPLAAAVCQVDGGRWLTMSGPATVTADPTVNKDAERRYAERYRPPGDRGDDRRTIEIQVQTVLGRG